MGQRLLNFPSPLVLSSPLVSVSTHYWHSWVGLPPPDIPPSVGFPLLFPALSTHCRSQNLSSLASFCRLQDDDLAGATHHQFIILELESLEATESYGRQRVGAPSTLHKSVRREAGFPPRSQGGDQSYPNVNIMLVVSAV